MVKRYEFARYDGGYYTDHEMNERDDGEYVMHEDYQALLAVVEAAKEMRRLIDSGGCRRSLAIHAFDTALAALKGNP